MASMAFSRCAVPYLPFLTFDSLSRSFVSNFLPPCPAFLKGVATGLAGAVIKPTAGMVGFASKTVGSIGDAIKESTQGILGGVDETMLRMRIKAPRQVSARTAIEVGWRSKDDRALRVKAFDSLFACPSSPPLCISSRAAQPSRLRPASVAPGSLSSPRFATGATRMSRLWTPSQTRNPRS